MNRWDEASRLAAQVGDSFYVLDEARIAANVAEFASAFRAHYPRTALAYPYKANHLPAICRAMSDLGVAAEVCSPMEWWLARRLGVPADRIIYTGAGRPAASIAEALLAGSTVNLDSARDLDIAARVALAHPDRDFDVGLRCSFALSGATGRRGSRFGIPVDDPQFDDAVEAVASSPGLTLAGLHCHFPGIELPLFAQRATILVEAARRAFPETPPHYLDMGGGFYGGVPVGSGGPAPGDYAEVMCPPIIAAFGADTTGPLLLLEPGTALVATALSYVTRIVDVKRWNGHTVAMAAGTLFDTSPNTRRTDFPAEVLSPAPRTGPGSFDVAGATPMPDEYLALGLPGGISAGDFVRFDNVGAYSISLSTAFVAPPPAVVSELADGSWRTLAPPGTAEQVMQRWL